jgi:hypothetical protein
VAVDDAGDVVMIGEVRTSSSANPDALIAKLNSDGNVLWTVQIGASTTAGRKNSTNWARGNNITVDSTGAAYATGQLYGTVDFDPGPGTTALTGPAWSAFVMKVSSNGGLVWAKNFSSGNFGSSGSSDIAVDATGKVYSIGSFSNAVDFDPGTLKSQKYILDTGGSFIQAVYVSVLDSSGNFIWAKSTRCMGTTDGVNSTAAEAIRLDGVGGLYVAGWFDDTVDFDPGTGAIGLTSAGSADAFVWKLDTGGNFVGAGQMGGTGPDFARGIGVDGTGSIYAAGNFSGTADLDPGSGTHNVTSAGGYDFFVAKFTQNAPVLALGANSDGDASTGPSTSVGLGEKEIRSSRHTVRDSAFADFESKLLDLLLLME